MSMRVVLAATHHDPDGLLFAQTERVLPKLQAMYSHLVVTLTAATEPRTRVLLRASDVTLSESDAARENAMRFVGLRRRQALEIALQADPRATHIHLCDFDRVLHWAECYPEELCATLEQLTRYDFTVLGRTPRAFGTHPRVQRDTEALINHVFALASGRAYDVSAASRGLSRRAAETIIRECADDTIGNDCSWPLCILRHEQLSVAYIETEGLEFETLDRYTNEIAALGGRDAWLARHDAQPREWALRLELARVEAESAASYALPREAQHDSSH